MTPAELRRVLRFARWLKGYGPELIGAAVVLVAFAPILLQTWLPTIKRICP